MQKLKDDAEEAAIEAKNEARTGVHKMAGKIEEAGTKVKNATKEGMTKAAHKVKETATQGGEPDQGESMTRQSRATEKGSLRTSLFCCARLSRYEYARIGSDFVHEVAPHGFAVQLLLRIRFEQGGDLRIGQRGTEPAALIVGTENDGHPAVGVVDVAHQRIGFGSDYENVVVHAAVARQYQRS